MTTLNQLLGFLMRAIVTGLAIAFVIVYLWPAAMNGRGQDDGKNTETPAGPSSYAHAVDRAAPAVVSINTRSVLPVPGPQVS
jgi:S1-C subfamily serine protease